MRRRALLPSSAHQLWAVWNSGFENSARKLRAGPSDLPRQLRVGPGSQLPAQSNAKPLAGAQVALSFKPFLNFWGQNIFDHIGGFIDKLILPAAASTDSTRTLTSWPTESSSSMDSTKPSRMSPQLPRSTTPSVHGHGSLSRNICNGGLNFP